METLYPLRLAVSLHYLDGVGGLLLIGYYNEKGMENSIPFILYDHHIRY
jgi:hypothetical protein